MINYWLMKSEPEVFSIEDLRNRPNGTEHWDGVRNYQARNMMRDQMRVGDLGFFYHSNCKEPGIAGILRIVRAGYPDFTALDPTSPYYDPQRRAEQPRWYMVDVQFVRALRRVITLTELKGHAELAGMPLLQRGNRLSVMPVVPDHWDFILGLE